MLMIDPVEPPLIAMSSVTVSVASSVEVIVISPVPDCNVKAEVVPVEPAVTAIPARTEVSSAVPIVIVSATVLSGSTTISGRVQTTKQSVLGIRCNHLIDLLRRKAKTLEQEYQEVGIQEKMKYLSHIPEKVGKLVVRLPYLEGLLNSEAAHPLDIYLAWCQLAGELAGINDQLIPPIFPPYNHNDIKSSIVPIEQYIISTLERLVELYMTILVKPIDGEFQIDLSHFPSDSPILIGVYATLISKEQRYVDWFESAFIATQDHIDAAVHNRVYGAKRKQINYYEPLKIIPSPGVTLYLVEVEDQFINLDSKLLIRGAKKENTENIPEFLIIYVPKQPILFE